MQLALAAVVTLLVACVIALLLLVLAFSGNEFFFWMVLSVLALIISGVGFGRVRGLAVPVWIYGLAAGGVVGAVGLYIFVLVATATD